MPPPTILILPGLGNSGPDHWQSFWEASESRMQRVVQRNWDRPDLESWLDTLQQSIEACASSPTLVAHSLACALVSHWSKRVGTGINAALLVAPADVDSPMHTPDVVRGFSPLPLGRFEFPSLVMASTDDPYVSLQRAQLFAHSWGSRFVKAGALGHINGDSKLGEWKLGRTLLAELD